MSKRLVVYSFLLAALLSGIRMVDADAPRATAGPWTPLLQDSSAPAWRGWKESGMPAGWHVDGGVLSKDGVGR